MQIVSKKVVTIDYTLKDDQGNVLDSSTQSGGLTYLHGAENIIPGLESALTGRLVGDELTVTVAPEDGYGRRDESMLQVVPRHLFGSIESIEPGMQFHAASPEGQPLIVTIIGVEGDDVTVDGNHPLAGVILNFAVKVLDIRDATEEEISHGHVHGAQGHHHE
jgi:FKBP-type peptidyl-prolyl cis-trans isomerase SlyD